MRVLLEAISTLKLARLATEDRCDHYDLEEAIRHLERVIYRRERAKKEAVMEALKK